MLTVVLPAHMHTHPNGSNSSVEKVSIKVWSYPKHHNIMRTIPLFGLFYAVYLCIQARKENKFIRSQLPYTPTDNCENPVCAEILNQRFGEAVLAFCGGFGVLCFIYFLYKIILVVSRILKSFCCCCFKETKEKTKEPYLEMSIL
ncbi:hypothetical protein [Chlamydia sp. 17-3921]|uniref:hypothetical protein n=1 Tax=Chlamydia sp. 17-3921 TaxID=2675798 RepID=UPI001919885C|nr:hypothetical protein [Chlamydia sp. 17-3921]